MKNWKTTVCGVLTILIQAAHAFPTLAPYVGPATAILTGLGLYHAQDK